MVGDRGLNPLKDQTAIGLLSDTGHPWISQNFQASILDVRPSLVHLNGVLLAISMALRRQANDDTLFMVFGSSLLLSTLKTKLSELGPSEKKLDLRMQDFFFK